jgi:hypothetical protein
MKQIWSGDSYARSRKQNGLTTNTELLRAHCTTAYHRRNVPLHPRVVRAVLDLPLASLGAQSIRKLKEPVSFSRLPYLP